MTSINKSYLSCGGNGVACQLVAPHLYFIADRGPTNHVILLK